MRLKMAATSSHEALLFPQPALTAGCVKEAED